MNVLKFRLYGNTAFFKKPDVNTYYYFTYGNIHKVALLGMFGAILGYGGYNQAKSNKKASYPEFYEKLKDLKIAIKPLNQSGIISRKIQIFNNSVGYASKELGGNLIVKEQWLENPSWNIYVSLDSDEAIKLSENILNNRAMYIPYLGKNDHIANMDSVEVIKDIEKENKVNKIDSLCPKENIIFDSISLDDEDEDDLVSENLFKYNEMLPIALDKDTNMYVLKDLFYSNMPIKSCDSIEIYNINGNNIVFF